VRQRSLIKMIAVLVPGIALGVIVPLLITREPPLSIDITNPTQAEDFVAPLAVTLSVERAAETLQGMGLKPVKYQWDFDGDGKENDETVLPTVSAYYDKQGSYGLVVRINLNDGSIRR